MTFVEGNIAGAGFFHIEISDGRIARVERIGEEDPRVSYCAPGFVDLQINGFAGVDFSASDLDEDALARVLPALWATGVTSFCPTLITNTRTQLESNFKVLEAARQHVAGFAASVPCYHLEGPYLSPGASRGAHDPLIMRFPDWEEFQHLQRAAGGNIGILTLAPELPDALSFIRRANQSGVLVAVSHTDGGSDHIHQAVAAGARFSTHLGNGCPVMIHRHLAPIWAQLANDRLAASIICDGFHLMPDFVQLVHRLKGREGCMLVTDAVHVAQLSPGRYKLVGKEIDLLPSGQVVTADGRSMAGSTLTMDRAVSIFMRMTGAPLPEALPLATSTPAKLLARRSVCSQIMANEVANLVLFTQSSEGIHVEQTILNGQKVHG